MNETARTRLTRAVPKAVLTIVSVLLLGAGLAQADTKYLADGAVQNSRGGWDLPAQGTCPAGAANGYGTIGTRPECVALRLVAADTTACSAILPASSTAWTTSGVCNDLINITQAACQATPGRLWNPGTGVCAVTMKGDDRNNVVCAKRGGTWVTAGTCTGAWINSAPASLITSSGPGDQCLRCHNNVTEYNGPRVRDTQNTMTQGHMNVARPAKAGVPWGGPPFSCTGHPVYTTEATCVAGGGTWDPAIYHATDTGDVFDWVNAKVTVGANAYDLKWIYGDWLSPLPRAIYVGGALTNMSYSCGRCHTTGWTSDATLKASKLPESQFPGVTWNGTGTTGQVKLGGGVSGDSNIMSSWDQWGISCNRCHSAAVDTTSHGGVPPFTAAPGQSTHHSNLTTVDNTSGVCTDVRFTGAGAAASFEANCTANGGNFLTACSVNPTPDVCTVAANTLGKCTAVSGTWVAAAGWCSNAFYTDTTSCTNNGNTWQDGWCKTADAKAACTGGSGDGAKTWRLNGTQQSCQVASATWSYSKCSVEGLCNKGTGVTSKSACDALGGQFAYASDVVRCIDAGGKWTGSHSQRGQIITALCMNCHRQETAGLPSDATAPAKNLKAGAYHSTITFLSHPGANQFLNSPHGKFTGTFAQIATGKFNYAGTGEYKSHFMADAEVLNTGNGCTGCHEVHTSLEGGDKPLRAECTECHTKSLSLVQHPSGIGTPLEKMATEPAEACASCHMPGGQHLFRINVDAAYSTIPVAGAMTGTVNANTAPDGTFTNAVWTDLDASCGQCHGGGTTTKATTGSITAASAVLTVASSTGFSPNEKIRITGAGAYYYDGANKYGDFDTYIKTVDSATQITLAGAATKTVAGAAVVQNAVKNGGGYISKAALAAYAKGMHNDKPTATFTAVYGANGATVNVDASATKCSGSASNCNAYAWSWGDGTPDGSLVTASHTYVPGSPSQTYTITLTATQYSVGPGVATQKFTAYPVNNRPTATGNCVLDYTQWTATCTNTGTAPDAGYQQLVFDWGDGTVINNVLAGPWNLPVVHTFLVPGTYKIKLKVVDTLGQMGTLTLATTAPASFNYYTVTGHVLGKGGAPALGAAQIQIKRNGTLVKSTMTAADGTYSTGAMKPGTYTLTVTKTGYTFNVPAATVTIGPNATPDIWAIAP